MFSYRHAFHAGNHADVLKHTVLIATLDHLLEKEAALTVVDTHAGAGLYRLDGDYAGTSGEAAEGVLRLLSEKKAPAAPAWVSTTVRAASFSSRWSSVAISTVCLSTSAWLPAWNAWR